MTTPKTPTDFDATGLTTTQQKAVEKLERSMTRGGSLADFVKAKTRRTIILVDCSGSMNARINQMEPTGPSKMDELRVAVADIRAKKAVPVAAFGHRGHTVELVDDIPNAYGGTPMHLAIDFAREQGANHIVLVTDGQPDSEAATLASAKVFGKPIEVFYIGDGTDRGAAFAKQLGALNGGSAEMSDISKPKELAGKITLMLGDGSL